MYIVWKHDETYSTACSKQCFPSTINSPVA
uniref:Uncharacterized protein n=1 Tax=Heterorhabditis bacteriophora TaxID=37862 RepID=A0A1I7WYD6_HETBA